MYLCYIIYILYNGSNYFPIVMCLTLKYIFYSHALWHEQKEPSDESLCFAFSNIYLKIFQIPSKLIERGATDRVLHRNDFIGDFNGLLCKDIDELCKGFLFKTFSEEEDELKFFNLAGAWCNSRFSILSVSSEFLSRLLLVISSTSSSCTVADEPAYPDSEPLELALSVLSTLGVMSFISNDVRLLSLPDE